MLLIGRLLFGSILRAFRSRSSLLLENLVLRQQIAVLKRKHPRPRIAVVDRLFWVLTRRVWAGWKQALTVVTPDTVVRWHREGFALYWRAISKARGVVGRKRISKEIRDLIFQMVVENPTWGAPRIHGELLMLGFDVSERTISRWMRRAPRKPEPAKRWLSFLHNHREAIAAMDFFTAPPSLSTCSPACSSSAMTGVASCTSTSPRIRPAVGSSSSCAKHFPTNPLPGSCSSTTIRSMDWRFPLPFALGKLLSCKPRSKVAGRTGL